MCGHYSVEWCTHGTLLLGATHLSLILYSIKDHGVIRSFIEIQSSGQLKYQGLGVYQCELSIAYRGIVHKSG